MSEELKLWYVTDSDDYYQYSAWIVLAQDAAKAIIEINKKIGWQAQGVLYATLFHLPTEENRIEFLEKHSDEDQY